MLFPELVTRAREQKGASSLQGEVLLSFDPGKTTGYAVFQGYNLVRSGQLSTPNVSAAFPIFLDLFQNNEPTQIVIEDYRVYKSKKDQHAWSELHTAKLIGVIEAAISYYSDLERLQIVPTMQMASQAKGFCTDDKLHEWNYYKTGEKHARDAIRHGCYYLLFGGDQQCRKTDAKNPKVTTVG